MSGILISLTGNQNNAYAYFVYVFFHFQFHPELSSTNVISITLYICLFICKRHLNVWKIIKEKKKKISKHMHLLQNLKVPRNVMGFSNWALTFTPLNY